jgi:hypothetical protein
MATKNPTKPTKKTPIRRPVPAGGSSPGSQGMGPYLGGVRGNPALIPGVREQ